MEATSLKQSTDGSNAPPQAFEDCSKELCILDLFVFPITRSSCRLKQLISVHARVLRWSPPRHLPESDVLLAEPLEADWTWVRRHPRSIFWALLRALKSGRFIDVVMSSRLFDNSLSLKTSVVIVSVSLNAT